MRLFPGPDSNVPLGEGYLIDILVCMVPTVWRESMMTANFEPMHHTLLEVVEYFEQLEVIGVQKRPENPRKPKRISQKTRSNPRLNLRKMAKRKILRRKERERNLPVMKMTPRNFAPIARKTMVPTGHTTQWTVGLSEQKKEKSECQGT